MKRKLKSSCKRGHRFTKRNTYVDKHGSRNCLKCRRMHSIARSKNPGIGSGGLNRIKTECKSGHRYLGKNLWIRIRKGKKTRVCKICTVRRTRENRQKVKQRVIKEYGGKCAIKRCKIKDPDMLTLDHVNDDGAKERIRGISSGDGIYRQLVRKGKFPKKYQILCANHNLKKELERKRAQS